MGPIGFPESSVTNYQPALHNAPQERRSQAQNIFAPTAKISDLNYVAVWSDRQLHFYLGVCLFRDLLLQIPYFILRVLISENLF
jgi:hypothetical protein